MALFDGSVVQSDGTDTTNTLPPWSSRNCVDGAGTGRPTVPTLVGGLSAPRLGSLIERAGGSAANMVLTGSKPV
jgi:hypothetical protein